MGKHAETAAGSDSGPGDRGEGERLREGLFWALLVAVEAGWVGTLVFLVVELAA